MLTIAYYILKVIICSGILYGYYRLALHNKLFHRWNRFYLLGAVIISLSFPLIKINIWHSPAENDGKVVRLLNVVTTGDEFVDEASKSGNFHISGEQAGMVLYVAVSFALLLFLIHTLVKLKKLVRQNPVQKINQINFVDTAAKGTPFSFFRYIFWNHQIDIESSSGRKIFLHELTHVKEKHSADRLFMNIVLVFFWCNPFFWLVRREMNMIHEFIADGKAVDDNDTAAFAAMILHAAYPQQAFGLTSNFFNSSIKRRLLMLTKMKNPRVSYIGRILALPLLTFIFVAFTVKTKQVLPESNITGNILLEKPITVVIDAGHGGEDAGAKNEGLQEKDITLLIAKKIKALNENSNVKIILTREADISKPVRERVEYVLTQKPDAFISLHVNAAGAVPENKGASGFEIYVSRKTNGFEKQTKLLASVVSQEIGKTYSIAPDLKQQNQRGIWVLDAPSINYPSIMIQCGYMTDKKDLAFINDEKNQEKIARDILSAIEKFAKAKDEITISFLNNSNEKVINDSLRFSAVPAKDNSSNLHQTKDEIIFKALSVNQEKDTIPQKIKSVDVTRDNNVIIIYNDNKAEKITKAEAEKRGLTIPSENSLVIKGPSRDSVLYYVEGVEESDDYVKTLKPGDIESITVLKSQNAADKYGERGRKGVIEITLKKGTVITRPVTLAELDMIFEKAEIDAKFPGGEGAWTKYISKAINNNIDELQKANKAGTCVVQFIVDTDGNISNIEALTMKNTKFSEVIIDAIKKGPQWIPAIQNGRKVKAYRKQPVTFQIVKA